MGLLDDFFDDVKAIRKELNDTKKDITSGFSGMTDDYKKFKQQANQTVDELKSETAKFKREANQTVDDIKNDVTKTNQEIKQSLSLNSEQPTKSKSEPKLKPKTIEDIKKPTERPKDEQNPNS